jgi:hypothetical protein
MAGARDKRKQDSWGFLSSYLATRDFKAAVQCVVCVTQPLWHVLYFIDGKQGAIDQWPVVSTVVE